MPLFTTVAIRTFQFPEILTCVVLVQGTAISLFYKSANLSS